MRPLTGRSRVRAVSWTFGAYRAVEPPVATMSHLHGFHAEPIVTVLHAEVPGRVRFHVRGLRHSGELASVLTEAAIDLPGVRACQPNLLTGNVLVRFDVHGDAGSIAGAIEQLVREHDRTGEADRTHRSSPVSSASSGWPRWTDVWLGVRRASRASRCGPGERGAGDRVVPSPGRGHAARDDASTPWHAMDIHNVLQTWESSRQGLATHEAERRLGRYGPNRLQIPAPPRGWQVFVAQFNSTPTILLLASAALSVVTGSLSDCAVILGVALFNAAIGTATERYSEATLREVTRLGPSRSLAWRDGDRREVPAEDLVPGDAIVLTRGAYIAADARVLETQDLTVDESALTGESVPVSKTTEAIAETEIALGDRRNMVYCGTVVTGGSGLGVVVATGSGTEMGRVHELLGDAVQPPSPIRRQLDSLSRQLVAATCAVAGAVVVIGWIRGLRWIETVQTAVSLAVAAVPEALPTVATTTLANGVLTMRRRNVVVRKLDAVEALGGTHVLCFDKTGTITRNRMIVQELVVGRRRLQVRAGRFSDDSGTVEPQELAELLRLVEVLVLCNEAEVVTEGDGDSIQGSATESALVRLALDTGVDVTRLRAAYPLLEIRQRTEGRMHMSTLHERSSSPGRFLAVKGRPDQVLRRCGSLLEGGEARGLTEADRSAIETENERLAGGAMRVLGAACLRADDVEVDTEDGWVWLGLVGIADPPRPEMRDVIRRLRQAGIRPVMVTGDQSATAHAVGRAIGLGHDGELEILDSSGLAALRPELLTGLAPRVDIFSRVSPSHKLQVVQALQQAGQIVAMTGDGINDGPALKIADIGIAMGKGADVARDVADVILLDEELETVLQAVAQGRAIQEDIAKSVHFIMATNLGEIAFTLAAVTMGLGVPLNPKQLLWTNVLTDVFPEIALAVEPPDGDVLQRPPRDAAAPLLAGRDYAIIAQESGIMTAATFASFLYGRARHGPGPAPRTMGFITLTVSQVLHTITARSTSHSVFDRDRLPRNPYIAGALGSAFALQAVGSLAKSLRGVLGTTGLPPSSTFASWACAGGSFVANELVKFMRNHARSPSPREIS